MINTTIKLIKTEDDYQSALLRIESLMDAEEGTFEADELEIWATLTELYEEKIFPIDLPDAIEAIQFRMEQADLSEQDLIPLIGSQAKVREVLLGKCALTLPMIRALNKHLKIPIDVLLNCHDLGEE